MGILAKVLIYGDLHLSSKNYGAHRDYPGETLGILQKITQLVEEENITHLIGLGDFSYGRFNTLEYRAAVEAELEKQHGLTRGNHYELKGNHDVAGYGMTEYEYYIQKGMLKPAQNLTIGNIHFTMSDYGKCKLVETNIDSNGVNILLAHDYFKFNSTLLPNFGKPIILDEYDKFYGIDYLICGHIHDQIIFKGSIMKQIDGVLRSHELIVQYPGSMSRPSYVADLPEEGIIIMLTIHDNGELQYDVINIELLPIQEAFLIEQKEIEKAKKAERERRLDISDVINELNKHQRLINDPEALILAMEGIPEEYKQKAIKLLHDSL